MAWQTLTLAPIDTGNVASFSNSASMFVIPPEKGGLSFPAVVEAVSTSLIESFYSYNVFQGYDLFAIAIDAQSLKEFGDKVQGLAKAFPVPQIDAMARKTAALFNMEASKKMRLSGPSMPMKNINLSRLPNLRKSNDAKEMAEAAARATGINIDPATRLSEIAGFAADIQTEATAAANSFVDPMVSTAKFISLNGLPDQIAAELISAANAPDYKAVYSGMVVFVGDDGALSDLAGLFA